MEESSSRRDYPKMMSTPEAAAYLAGADAGTRVNQGEFMRFAETYGLKPIETLKSFGARRSDISVRQKWSKRHIDLVLLTGLPFREALKWAQGAKLMIG